MHPTRGDLTVNGGFCVHWGYFIKECGMGQARMVGVFFWIIETASLEEIAMVDKRMKDYEKDPSSFISLKEIK